MIRLGKITYSQTDTKAKISLPIVVKGKEESLYIEADLDYGKFFVTDRCDAFVTGILYAAMFLNEDIVCEMPVSGELKYMLEAQFITTLANHSNQFHKIKISSEVTNEPLQNHGGGRHRSFNGA